MGRRLDVQKITKLQSYLIPDLESEGVRKSDDFGFVCFFD